MAVEERDPVLGEVAASSAATPERRPLVELGDVNKHFGELHVLRDINLTVLPARCWCSRPVRLG